MKFFVAGSAIKFVNTKVLELEYDTLVNWLRLQGHEVVEVRILKSGIDNLFEAIDECDALAVIVGWNTEYADIDVTMFSKSLKVFKFIVDRYVVTLKPEPFRTFNAHVNNAILLHNARFIQMHGSCDNVDCSECPAARPDMVCALLTESGKIPTLRNGGLGYQKGDELEGIVETLSANTFLFPEN